jgi:hypothetical protein
MATLFGKEKRIISEHIRNIFNYGELGENVVVRKIRMLTVQYLVKRKNHKSIYERVDVNKPFMELTTFSDELLIINDIKVAKNYLSVDELKYQVKMLSPVEHDYMENIKNGKGGQIE